MNYLAETLPPPDEFELDLRRELTVRTLDAEGYPTYRLLEGMDAMGIDPLEEVMILEDVLEGYIIGKERWNVAV